MKQKTSQLKGGKRFRIRLVAWERPNGDWRQRSAGDFTLRVEKKVEKETFRLQENDASSDNFIPRGEGGMVLQTL